MLRGRSHPVLLSAALAACMALCGLPAAAHGLSAARPQAAASGTQAPGSPSTWRVMLVISQAVRSYQLPTFLAHIDYGGSLARQFERVCQETFASVKTVSEFPADAHGYDGIDLVIVLDVPQGGFRRGLLSNTLSLTEGFAVRNTKGEEIYRVQESSSDSGLNLMHGPDRLSEVVSRQFVKDLLANANVRNALAPAAPVAAPVETKPVLADTTVLDSGGLEVPPPAPWNQPLPVPANVPGSGRP
jgi:hypothetical protein